MNNALSAAAITERFGGLVVNKVVSLIVTAVAFLATCIAAQAADLPMAPVYQPPPVVVPVYNWTGFYIGANGGYGWGSQDPFNLVTNRFDNFSTSLSGGVFGGTLGAQMQMAHVVMGLEADLDWANIKGSTVANPTILGFPQGAVNATTNIN
jgi:outer membrane immunogenic protein